MTLCRISYSRTLNNLSARTGSGDAGQFDRLSSMTALVNKEGHKKKTAQVEEEGQNVFCLTIRTETY